MSTVITAPELAAQRIREGLGADSPLGEDLQTEHMFSTYIVNLLEDRGLHWRGQSVKNQGWSVLLVVKVARDSLPLVGFFTERTTTHCMRLFLKKLAEGTINWQKDKFA